MNTMEQAVRRGNVVYTLESFQTGIPHVPPMVSSGIVGGCFDWFGFMGKPDTGVPEGRTVLGYIGQHARVEHGRHIQFPLAVVGARFADGSDLNLVDCRDYRQELDLLSATLTTTYDLYGPLSVTAFASQAAPNLMVLHVDRQTDDPAKALRVRLECETSRSQNLDMRWKVPPVELSFRVEGDRVHVTGRTNALTNEWILDAGGAGIRIDGSVIELDMPAGATTLKLWVRHAGCPGPEVLDKTLDALRGAHEWAWAKFWREAWVDLPEDRAQWIWTRTNYYVGCNFPPVPARPMVPTGLMSNIWGFYFPQDVYYVAENAPRLGHLDRAKAALRYWLEHLEDVKAYGKRLLGVEGAYYPWTPPYQDWDQYEIDGITGPDSYELHNSAYVVAMVWHYYQLTQDEAFLREFFPVIQEVARFYLNIAVKNEQGTYDTYHEHARGQDEHSSTAGRLKNLLCCGYSAEYTCRAFVEAAEITAQGDSALLERARDAVACGFERKSLLRPQGWYSTYAGDDRPAGSQKHPVQLNPIAYLPMADLGDSEPTVRAWRHRYDLTARARRPHSPGWTLGEFALASARMGDGEALETDLRAIQPCRMADPRWIQFYESSFIEGWHLKKAYYFTTSGLYLQAFTDCLVQDWRGFVDLFACLLPGWAERSLGFEGLRARGGVILSGAWQQGGFEVTLRPAGATSVRLRVGRADARVHATGQATGPADFAGMQVVELTFDAENPIVLTGVG